MVQSLPQVIAAALDSGKTLLTPTQRAARVIRRAYDAEQLAAGRSLWSPANVLPLETWLAAEWHQHLLNGAESRLLLNRTQEHTLWREIIQTDPGLESDAPRVRSADALADLAARAWSLLNLYEARARLQDFPLSTDSRAFERWSRAFERRISRDQLITRAELPTALTSHARSAALGLVDFDTLPPAIDRLMNLMHAERMQTAWAAGEIYQHAAVDDSSELQAAARWVLERRKQDPQARIAIVVPDLAKRRAAIDRAFGPILQPDALPISAPPLPPAYEFSLGRPLAELPLITTALDLLSWVLEPLSLDRISSLLLSPWLLPLAHTAIAEFDAFEFRQLSLLRPELTLDRTLSLLQKSLRRDALKPLIDSLNSLQRTARERDFGGESGRLQARRQSHAIWADSIRAMLEASGWSNQAHRTSTTYQQHRRWESALDELATLDAIVIPGDSAARRPTARESLTTLTRILRQTVFAPESKDAPVQILGPLEPGGIPFDALWFLSADDLTWPASSAVNPLLPWQLQRNFAMPGGDRTHDDAAARALTTRIAHSAAVVVFSYARHAEEGERRPSPLLAVYRPAPLVVTSPAAPTAPLELESFADNISLPPLPERVTRGGSRVLQLQAACAFRAFAETRLHSTQPDSRLIGLNAMERGALVHHAMEAFWTSIDSQQALRSLTSSERESLLTRSIVAAIESLKVHPNSPWDEAYLWIQHQRLQTLLKPWLEIELQRSPFTVLPPEEPHQFRLGPVTLALRIDRIDVTPEGRHLILDYKTGEASPASWHGERPDEPQLPLYAVLADQLGRQLAGVAFALLRPGNGMGLKGYAEDQTLLPQPAAMEAASLAEQVEGWRFILTSLAEDYAAGDTRVAPKLYPQTCERCTQRMLCRLDPTTLTDSPQLDQDQTDQSTTEN